MPFITENRKPKRNQALAYYREVVTRKNIRVHAFEKVERVTKQADGTFIVETSKHTYEATYVVIATGYYDNPNYMNVPGEHLPKVTHYFKEAHPYYNTDCVVIGGKNSSVDAALELVKAGARVTVLYRAHNILRALNRGFCPNLTRLYAKGSFKWNLTPMCKKLRKTRLFIALTMK
ncbi:Ferredoxin--NADP reductase [Anoxybacillus sp. BCO1]|nr:Ferredoxin--NADP reductase [Anoxybacillus sp. BCO1]